MNTLVENEVIELKRSTSELKEAIISIVAILNKHQNGKLYFGIDDNGKVLGQNVSGKTLRDISEAINSKIEPKIYPQINKIKLDNKDCVLVEFEGNDVPYLAEGRAYIRVSDADKKLSALEMRKLLLNTVKENYQWDIEISDKTVNDVNEEVLKRYIMKASEAKRIPYGYTTKEDVLNKLGLIKDGYLLNAGKVLFCDNSNVTLQMAIFATDTKTTFIDIDRVDSNIFDLIEEAQKYIRKNIIWNVKITDTREETPEIPLDSIREAIINSFVHKNYLDPKGVEISIFNNRVEIYNPGTFPEEYTPEDYINSNAHSIFRNPLIASTLYKSSDIESYSSGIQRMYRECNDNNVKIEFRKEKIGFVVTFYRQEINTVPFTVPNDTENGTVNEKEESIIQLIENKPNITQTELAKITKLSIRTIKRIMKNLQNEKTIERIGADKNGYWKINKR